MPKTLDMEAVTLSEALEILAAKAAQPTKRRQKPKDQAKQKQKAKAKAKAKQKRRRAEQIVTRRPPPLPDDDAPVPPHRGQPYTAQAERDCQGFGLVPEQRPLCGQSFTLWPPDSRSQQQILKATLRSACYLSPQLTVTVLGLPDQQMPEMKTGMRLLSCPQPNEAGPFRQVTAFWPG